MLYCAVIAERRTEYHPEAHNLSHARKLFFLSFEHSQGNTSLQKHIFDYLHHLHPDWIRLRAGLWCVGA